MVIRSSEAEKIDSLRDILSSLETTSQVRPEIEKYAMSLSNRLHALTRDYYASLIFLFTTPLSFHQRLIFMQLISMYPQGSSGIDLARALGISVQSKSIYRDLKILEKQGLVRIDEVHSRLKMAYANFDNQLVNRLVELVQIHGESLRELLKDRKEKG
ncbi:MAG: hypothetical protein JSW11_15700 [Candidatus Heimdallarchaeota archaeon]|nr:MAG: hypothetical protein JSW11_15700 [Candidatus Heimdallarchaeota archaeon]